MARVETLFRQAAQFGLLRKEEVNPRVGSKPITDRTHFLPITMRAVDQETIDKVQKFYRSGFWTQKELASAFGVSPGVINRIVRCIPQEAIADAREKAKAVLQESIAGGRRQRIRRVQ